MTEGWVVGMALNGVIGVAFLIVGVILAVRLTLQRDWRSNVLATAFCLVALTCGAGHLGRSLVLAAPSLGFLEVTGGATRIEFDDWHMWVADGVTALAGVFYVAVRFRSKELLWTSKVFDDLHERRRRAMLIHDQVVQDLVEGKLALEVGERERGLKALERAVRTSKSMDARAPKKRKTPEGRP